MLKLTQNTVTEPLLAAHKHMEKTLIISIVLRLRMSAYAYTYALVKTSRKGSTSSFKILACILNVQSYVIFNPFF